MKISLIKINSIKYKKGFTLLETLLYIAMLGIIVSLITVVMTTILASYSSAVTIDALTLERISISQNIEKYFSGDYEISSPVIADQANSITLTEKLNPTNIITISLNSNQLVTNNGLGLSSPDFIITNLSINRDDQFSVSIDYDISYRDSYLEVSDNYYIFGK